MVQVHGDKLLLLTEGVRLDHFFRWWRDKSQTKRDSEQAWLPNKFVRTAHPSGVVDRERPGCKTPVFPESADKLKRVTVNDGSLLRFILQRET